MYTKTYVYENFHNGKKTSVEPDLNQWPKDSFVMNHYSSPLYQLSYRRLRLQEIRLI